MRTDNELLSYACALYADILAGRAARVEDVEAVVFAQEAHRLRELAAMNGLTTKEMTATLLLQPSPHDFPEDFPLENGCCISKCNCGSMFQGLKSRHMCKVCEEKWRQQWRMMSEEERDKYRQAATTQLTKFIEQLPEARSQLPPGLAVQTGKTEPVPIPAKYRHEKSASLPA